MVRRPSGDVIIQDSRGTRVWRRGDWRTRILRLMAVFVALYAPIQLASSMSHGFSWGHIAPPAAVFVAALGVILINDISDRTRAFLLSIPMMATGILGVYYVGASPVAVLVFAQVTVVVGLVLGPRAGGVALLATAVAFGVVGALGKAKIDDATWLYMAATYAVATGVLLAAVSLAARRGEQAYHDVRQTLAQAERLRGEREEARAHLAAADERLQLTLEAASVVPWSMPAASRRIEFGASRGTLQEQAFASPPQSLEEMLSRVPEAERGRVRDAFEDVLTRRAPELKIEHTLLADDGTPRWYDVRGRLARLDDRDVLVGISVDATVRRNEDARRADAQARLLRLSTSDTFARGDLAAAMREITEVGLALLDVARCGVWLHGADGKSLECVDLYSKSGHAGGPRLDADAHPRYFAALSAQRTLTAHDATTDERTRELLEYLTAQDVSSMLDAAIHVRGRLVGVLCHEHVGWPARRWSVDDELAAASLADFASRAVEASERAHAERRLQVAYAQLGQITRRMESVREEERRTIARELHDELGQNLTAVKLHVALAAQEGGGARLGEITGIVDRALHTTRELSRAMRPPLLDEVGLVPALQAFLDEQARYSEVEFGLEAQLGSRPSTEIETAAFRVVQEAVTNVLRHAKARHVRVKVAGNKRLTLSITDDGAGFDVERALERAAAGGHLGVVGMRERVRALGGHFGVRSTLGTGTEVRVELPIAGGA